MKVLVNEECILCGLCADICPEVFKMGDEIAEVIVEEVPPDQEECCGEAAEECPVDAIELD